MHRPCNRRLRGLLFLCQLMLLAGCSDNNIARKSSDLREEIARYAQGPKDRATEISIEQKILKDLPFGSTEAEVCENIRQNFKGKVPDPEKFTSLEPKRLFLSNSSVAGQGAGLV